MWFISHYTILGCSAIVKSVGYLTHTFKQYITKLLAIENGSPVEVIICYNWITFQASIIRDLHTKQWHNHE